MRVFLLNLFDESPVDIFGDRQLCAEN